MIRDEIKHAHDDITHFEESQKEIILLLHSLFTAGQERVKTLDLRAKNEKTKSQIRLSDLSDKIEVEFAVLPDVPNGTPRSTSHTTSLDKIGSSVEKSDVSKGQFLKRQLM